MSAEDRETGESLDSSLVGLNGRVLGDRYRLEALIDSGGMGSVYRGVHLWTERVVAVKVLHRASTRRIRRFFREAQAAARLDHPNVVDILDMGEDEGLFFLVMELLRGETLRELLARKPLRRPRELYEILGPILLALEAAHAKGLIHRDLKPENIFLAETHPGQRVPKLLDFGIVKNDRETAITKTGETLGTPVYMAPEQVDGTKRVGPHIDIWAMGVIMFEATTGVSPFERDTVQDSLNAILTTRAPRVEAVAPGLDSSIANLINRCLERSIAARYASIAAVRTELETIAQARDSSIEEEARCSAASDRQDAAATAVVLPALQPTASRASIVTRVEAIEVRSGSPSRPQATHGSEIVLANFPARKTMGLALAVLSGCLIVTGGAAWFLSRADEPAPVARPPSGADSEGRVGAHSALEPPAALVQPAFEIAPADEGTSAPSPAPAGPSDIRVAESDSVSHAPASLPETHRRSTRVTRDPAHQRPIARSDDGKPPTVTATPATRAARNPVAPRVWAPSATPARPADPTFAQDY